MSWLACLLLLSQTPGQLPEAERRAYDRLLRTRTPAAVQDFLSRFPDSWLLASVYEIGARAALARQDTDGLLRYGRASLALVPENATLLAPMALAARQAGRPREAERWARQALLWLDTMEPPAGVDPQTWQKVEEDVRSAVREVLGVLPARRTRRAPSDRAYAGSDRCRECHAPEHRHWSETGMARMLRPFRRDALLTSFDTPTGIAGTRAFLRDGRPWMEIGNAAWPVDFVIGSKWQQAYATRRPNGELHVFPIQYSRLLRRWVNYWERIDPEESERARIARFPRLDPATSYQRNCGSCHTSQLRARSSTESALGTATFDEAGVNCEMCHGPSAAHAKAPERGGTVSFRRLDASEEVAICSQCHMQSAVRRFGPDGEVNFAPEEFPRTYRSRGATEFSRKGLYRDGRFRETTFIVESFRRSRCFQEGGARCGNCHHPHPPDAASNPVSLKHRDRPDEMCLPCHSAMRAETRRHTRHDTLECVDCHMPRIQNALLFAARTHTLDDIPRSETARRYGPDESPNACLLCHRDKDVSWLERELRAWRISGSQIQQQ